MSTTVKEGEGGGGPGGGRRGSGRREEGVREEGEGDGGGRWREKRREETRTRFVQYSKGQVSTTATNSEFGSTRDLETVKERVNREVFEIFHTSRCFNN